MTVRKGVFPAAGLGTRFLPATKALPKEMLPAGGKPLIQHAVEEAVAAGIEDVVIVTGRGKHAIEDHFDHSLELETILAERGQEHALGDVLRIAGLCRFAYTRQKRALGLGHAVGCARALVGDETFAVSLADDLILSSRPATGQLIDLHERTGASVVAVQRVPPDQVGRYGVIEVRRSDGRVHEVADLVEKPRPGRAPSDLAVLGRYVLRPSIFPHIDETPPGARGEIQLTDALRRLVRAEPLLALEIEGRRFDAGTRVGYVQAIVELALADHEKGEVLRAWLAERLQRV